MNNAENKDGPFVHAIKDAFDRYADFQGRTLRPDYWWFVLFVFLISAATSVVHQTLYLLFSLAIVIPVLAAGTRRLRDAGRSGWWQVLFLVPLGFLVVFILLAQPSRDEMDVQDQ